ncbi:dicarboxylate/amino acid:cation symporter [Weissella sagaensis]|uniref:dicarboxylate/amino acid:cation symporter n=1 Tax=Weissella sagaensis TaxID=2559928 RepID=UPI0005A8B5A3|nr:dicarboxylate/amino acid:cation symporter [Weissella sagaensis]QDJ59677.1 dicarboxylate/amino acid:cation symporter [Weissella hellenica]QEA56991.1 dicarboxylate/amino acid:cation symporter [Weissella hellenica]UEG67805.1 dicarboxylate/amino acid:cation symporter [Weissella hellenica]
MRIKLGLTTQIIIGAVLGIILGAVLRSKIADIKIIGDIFLRLIQMAVIPLVFCTVIAAIGKLPIKQLGRLGMRIVLWFTITTVIAALVGLILGCLFHPGMGLHLTLNAPLTDDIVKNKVALTDMILGFFPTNIFEALTQGNTIQVIIFALLFGVVLSKANTSQQYDAILTGLQQLNQLLVSLIQAVLRLAPLGIGALMAAVTADNGLKVLIPLIKFLGIFGLGTLLFLMGLFTMIMLRAHMSLHAVLHGFANIILIAMTTTSSAASLPVEMHDAEKRLGVGKEISELVLPLGMALNSNGLAMYLALACVTMTQFYGLSLSFLMMLEIVLLAIVACLGTVAVPGGGLVALTIIVPALGLPLESIALLAGIDWFAGIFRTTLNVVGDTTTAIMIAADEHELSQVSVSIEN